MKLTKDMKYHQKGLFYHLRTIQKVKPINHLIDFTGSNSVFIKKTNTLIELVDQIDQITGGEEFDVVWYNLDGPYLQLRIICHNIDIYLYCKEILSVLENFLHVECKLEEKQVATTASIKTVKSIICIKEA